MSMSPRRDDDKDDSCIRIPVRGANQTVEVYTDELPADYNDVVDVLKAEIAPLDIWLRFAVSDKSDDHPLSLAIRRIEWCSNKVRCLMHFSVMPRRC